MKRGKPLQRRTPLRATSPSREERDARTRAAMDRQDARRRDQAANRATRPRSPSSKPAERAATADPVTPKTRAKVRARSGGYCEARVAPHCSGHGEHVHHRKRRGHGDHRLCNLLHVCHACHTHIHSSVFAVAAYARRFLLYSHQDPEAEPVRHAA